MNDIQLHIAKAEALIQSQCEKTKQFDKIYPFSNENLAAFLPHFQLENKDCLTVLGSGDQVLDMAHLGAKTIHTFDINPLTKYYFYLKKAALMSSISYEQYLKFFCYEDYPENPFKNANAFDEKTFDKLVPYLKDDNYTFWTALFNTFDFDSLQIRESKGLFTADELSCQVLKQSINYLQENNFYNLKEKANDINIEYIESDILTLNEKLTEKYDFMYVSNIIQYTDQMYEKDMLLSNDQNRRKGLENYKNTIETLGQNLREKGQPIVNYLYEPNKDFLLNYRGAIYEDDLRTSIFNNYTYLPFTSINTMNFRTQYGFNPDDDKDACLIYQKAK